MICNDAKANLMYLLSTEIRNYLRRFFLINKTNQLHLYILCISAPGSCHGDSGGPVFQPALHEGKSIYVVLGDVVMDSMESVNQCCIIQCGFHLIF